MINLEDKIVSLDIFEKHFKCDLKACKGACCVEGDSGAPITKKEQKKIEKIYKDIKPYMRKEGITEVEKKGVSVLDSEGELTTTLVKNKECVFVYYEEGVSKCAIEKSHLEKKTNFKKPISCHLFPIRIKKYPGFEAVNYEKIKICNPACNYGDKLKLPLYEFLKEALVRKYGKRWYKKLLIAADLIRAKGEKKEI